eukprot:3456169-Rhodomonas_salina.11
MLRAVQYWHRLSLCFPALTQTIVLAISCGYQPMRVLYDPVLCYAPSGTDRGYVLPGTDADYHATCCPVLMSAMLLPDGTQSKAF